MINATDDTKEISQEKFAKILVDIFGLSLALIDMDKVKDNNGVETDSRGVCRLDALSMRVIC